MQELPVADEGDGRPENHPVGDGQCLRLVHIGRHHRELVPAEPGRDIPRAHDVTQPVGEPDQDLVPNLMAEGVVDGLEAIQVDLKDGDAGQIGVALDEYDAPFLQLPAVRQPGHGVVQCCVPEVR